MMLRVCRNDKQSVLGQVRNGKIDAVALSTTNLVDDIIHIMHTNGILGCLEAGIEDRRSHNTTVLYNIIWASAIAAKMKISARNGFGGSTISYYHINEKNMMDLEDNREFWAEIGADFDNSIENMMKLCEKQDSLKINDALKRKLG